MIICGDSALELSKIETGSVDMVLTSPPYDNLRDYKGFTFNFEVIALELSRILAKGGVIIWVVGDATINGSETGTSFRQALFFKEQCGLNIHDTMIFKKLNPIMKNHNRYEQDFEYIFCFSKGRPKTFNPLLVPCKTAGKIYNVNRNKIGEFDKNSIRSNRSQLITTKPDKIHGNIFEYMIGSCSVKNKSQFKHPATFPEDLAKDQILSWTNEGDLVLDPFNGSGTTTKVSQALNRKFIGIEISQEYCTLAQQRLLEVPNG